MASLNGRIKIKKENARATTVGKITTRVSPLPVAVMRDEDKGSRRHRVRNTHLGIRPIDAKHPTSVATVPVVR